MERRTFLLMAGAAVAGTACWGCRGRQVGHVLDDSQQDMVGSHTAGAETYNRLVDESVARLLGREHEILLTGAGGGARVPGQRVCFVGVENRSAEEVGDFKEQLYQQIDSAINNCESFQPISRRKVEAGLRTCHLRPEDLFTPDGQRAFQAAMEQDGQSFDYLMFATLTSGTTVNNNDKQRDYLLTLELVNIDSGQYSKDSAKVRKGYHQNHVGKWKNYNPFTKR